MTGKVLITGASGFIGRPLARQLAASGWQVRAAARDAAALSALAGHEAIELIALPDLSKPADWAPLLDGASHVVHLAGIAHAPGQFEEEAYRRINTEAVGELAGAARQKGIHLVFMSSVRAQAGLSSVKRLSETDPPLPTDPYGRSKLEAERLVEESGADYTILRPVVVYGPGVKGNIASLATLARTPMPLPFASLDNSRSLVSVENLIGAVELAMSDARLKGETFLVADQAPISVAGIITAMRAGLGRSPQLVPMPLGAVRRILKSFGREADWERIAGDFVVSSGKLQALGWVPRIDTAKGLEAMMRQEGASQTL